MTHLIPVLVLGSLMATALVVGREEVRMDEAGANAVGTSWSHWIATRVGAQEWRFGLEAALSGTGDDPGLELLAGSESAVMESPELKQDAWFNEVLLSWNVEAPEGTGFVVDIRVGGDDEWSPWLRIGSWGDGLPDEAAVTSFGGGRIDVDIFRSKEHYRRFQHRVRVFAESGGAVAPVVVRRVTCCLSDRGGAAAPRPADDGAVVIAESARRRLPVPFRSQRDADEAISANICSPTSVAMLLEYRSREHGTAKVAERLFDPEHRIYGNWARAVQGAFSFGVPGFLARFSSWNQVSRLIAEGQPLIITIAAQEGELTGAPYRSTRGHLLALVGFDADGNVEVNDPAASSSSAGQAVYLREELDRVWMRRGGVAYVLLGR